MPKVSICIPTFNRMDYLKETLASVFAQTFQDYEVMVIDDGSTDGTREMIESLSLPVNYIYQENAGTSACRNRFIDLARGEYLAFLDSDDLYYPDSIERLYGSIEPYGGKACAYGGYIRIDQAGREMATRPKMAVLPSGNISRDLFKTIIVHPGGSMYPLAVLKESPGFDPRLRVCCDYDLELALSLKYPFIAQQKPTFKRRRHGSNVSAESFENLQDKAKVLRRFLYERGGEKVIPEQEAARRLGRLFYRMGLCAYRERLDRATVRECFGQSMESDFKLKTLLRSVLATLDPVFRFTF